MQVSEMRTLGLANRTLAQRIFWTKKNYGWVHHASRIFSLHVKNVFSKDVSYSRLPHLKKNEPSASIVLSAMSRLSCWNDLPDVEVFSNLKFLSSPVTGMEKISDL